jgi:hypothetical protein
MKESGKVKASGIVDEVAGVIEANLKKAAQVNDY